MFINGYREYRCWGKGIGTVTIIERGFVDFWIDKFIGVFR